MDNRNLHKAYYKDYFSGINFASDYKKPDGYKNLIASNNESLTNPELLRTIGNDISPKEHRFKLKVQYPGLITGIGINHEVGIEGEVKLGLHFDWTWGMPVVYGSSVKGVLRSYFKDFYKESDIRPKTDQAFDDIFEDKDHKKSIYKRDIFFDAVFTAADPKGRLFCTDSITPHKEPLQDPKPITFLKIAPGCTIEFRFKLEDTVIDGKKFSKEEKLALFKEILSTVGVGAKTNVGYGQLQ